MQYNTKALYRYFLLQNDNLAMLDLEELVFTWSLGE